MPPSDQDVTSPARFPPQDDVRIAALDALGPVMEWIRVSSLVSGRSPEHRSSSSSEEEKESAAVFSECAAAAIRDAVRDVETARGVDMALRDTRLSDWLSWAKQPTS